MRPAFFKRVSQCSIVRSAFLSQNGRFALNLHQNVIPVFLLLIVKFTFYSRLFQNAWLNLAFNLKWSESKLIQKVLISKDSRLVL